MADTDTPQVPKMEQLWQHFNWQPSAQQQEQFQQLYELILEGNKQLNLTRITQPLEFWEKHLWDSVRGIAPLLNNEVENTGQQILPGTIQKQEIQLMPSSLKVVDIGTGAGFPGLPVAIALTSWHVTLLDSIRKKITFLNHLIEQLGIQNASTVIGRAEILGKQFHYRQTYDLALVRAVGSACACAHYTLPFLKPGGLAVLYRGNWTTDEAQSLQTTVKNLGSTIESTQSFTTPLSNSIRHCVYLRKGAGTPTPLPKRA